MFKNEKFKKIVCSLVAFAMCFCCAFSCFTVCYTTAKAEIDEEASKTPGYIFGAGYSILYGVNCLPGHATLDEASAISTSPLRKLADLARNTVYGDSYYDMMFGDGGLGRTVKGALGFIGLDGAYETIGDCVGEILYGSEPVDEVGNLNSSGNVLYLNICDFYLTFTGESSWGYYAYKNNHESYNFYYSPYYISTSICGLFSYYTSNGSSAYNKGAFFSYSPFKVYRCNNDGSLTSSYFSSSSSTYSGYTIYYFDFRVYSFKNFSDSFQSSLRDNLYPQFASSARNPSTSDYAKYFYDFPETGTGVSETYNVNTYYDNYYNTYNTVSNIVYASETGSYLNSYNNSITDKFPEFTSKADKYDKNSLEASILSGAQINFDALIDHLDITASVPDFNLMNLEDQLYELVQRTLWELNDSKLSFPDLLDLLDLVPGTFVDKDSGQPCDTIPSVEEINNYNFVTYNFDTYELDPSIEVSPPEELHAYAESLSDYFPFCLPFDAYALGVLFIAEPQIPEFEVSRNFIAGVEQDPENFISSDYFYYDVSEDKYVLTLKKFDKFAGIVRSFILIIFVVGLCLGFKKFIHRS